MKAHAGLKFVLFSLIVVMVGLLAGCASTNRAEWDARIGHYTYDDAVSEFGPPDKMARLTDGKLVADWITRYNNGSTMFIGSGFSGRGGGGFVQAVGPSTYVDILRLSFDSHYVLCAWAKK